MENTRDLLGWLHLGGVNWMDLLWVGWRKIVLKEMTRKKRHFGGQEKALCKKYSHKSTRTNPAKTPSYSGYIDWTGILLWSARWLPQLQSESFCPASDGSRCQTLGRVPRILLKRGPEGSKTLQEIPQKHLTWILGPQKVCTNNQRACFGQT